MMKKLPLVYLIPLIIIAVSANRSLAQTGSVKGQVVARDHDPLQGATVLIEGTTLGTSTGSGGAFLIENVTAGEQILIVRYVGYSPVRKQITIKPGTVLETNISLSEDLLGMDEVIVSGTFNPATKLESSTAITTLNPVQIESRVPQGTAGLLRAVPGVQSITSYGEAGADVTFRGLPKTENSSFRYISLQEDGLPVFEPPGLLFAFPDAYARFDETIARVEVVRGGTAPVFTSNTPGGIVNLISKTGGPELAGVLKNSVGLHGMVRQDFNVGGPLLEDWRFNFGGYYRHDEGVRDPGYPANRGGQLKLNLTRDFKTGYLRLYGKYLNERDVWFMGIPFQNYEDPERIPGGPKLGTGTTFSPHRRMLTIPDAFNPGADTQKNMDNGFAVSYKMAGLELHNDKGNGWDITLRSRFLSSDNTMNLMVDVADPFPITAFAQPGIPASVPRFVQFVNSGETVMDQSQVTNLNGNGLMSVHGMAFSEQQVSNFIGNLQVTRQLGDHDLNGGLYYSTYRVDWQLVQAGVFLEVANHPRFIQVMIPGQNGSPVGLTPADGFAGYNTSYWNLHSTTNLAAFYLGDNWEATDGLNVDMGIRFDLNFSNGANERPVDPGAVQDGNVVGQQAPPGYPAFVPTPDQSRAGMFGSGRYRTWDYTFNTLGGSVGLNYQLTDQFAVYGRGSSGHRAPTVQQWTFQATNGSQITGNTVKGEVEHITQVETGIKLKKTNWSLLLTGFYSRSENLISNFHRGQPDGSFEFLAVTGNTRTFGMEIETVARPLDGFELRLNATFQDPRFTKFEYGFFIPGNNQFSGLQSRDYSGNKLNDLASILADASFSYNRDWFSAFFGYRYTGERKANRLITLPAYGEARAGIGVAFEPFRVSVSGTNLFNTRAVSHMAQQTGEDIIQVNEDGTAEFLETSGPRAGTTTNTFYTTGQGIFPRTIFVRVAYTF